MKRIGRMFYADRLVLLFLAGSISGGIAANLLSGKLLEQIGFFDWSKIQMGGGQSGNMIVGGSDAWGLPWRRGVQVLLKQRFVQLGLGAVMGMTPVAAAAYSVFTFAAGAAMAVLVAVCTIYGGWLGLGIFLKAMLPQWLFYLPVYVILAAAAENGTHRIKGVVWLLLIVLTGIGAGAEGLF